jgi:hypothetical protein
MPAKVPYLQFSPTEATVCKQRETIAASGRRTRKEARSYAPSYRAWNKPSPPAALMGSGSNSPRRAMVQSLYQIATPSLRKVPGTYSG